MGLQDDTTPLLITFNEIQNIARTVGRLDWARRIVVIDSDQGESGASAAWREGFQRLVSDVGMGRAGIVMDPPSPAMR